MERVKGFEPSTLCLASIRSSQLSYTRNVSIPYLKAVALSILAVAGSNGETSRLCTMNGLLFPPVLSQQGLQVLEVSQSPKRSKCWKNHRKPASFKKL